jgi:hypothetical protein
LPRDKFEKAAAYLTLGLGIEQQEEDWEAAKIGLSSVSGRED